MLFVATIIFLIISYLRYLVDDIVPKEYHDDINNFMFLAGFTKTCSISVPTDCSLLISECYGYLIILSLLIIERHCLQCLTPKSQSRIDEDFNKQTPALKNDLNDTLLESPTASGLLIRKMVSAGMSKEKLNNLMINNEKLENLNKKPKKFIHAKRNSEYFNDKGQKVGEYKVQRYNSYNSGNKSQVFNDYNDRFNYDEIKKKIYFVSSLILLKFLIEALISMILLILGFYKITIISIIYVFFIFLGSFFTKINKIIILNSLLIICIWIQYLLILSNSSDYISPYPVPKTLSD